MRQMSHQTTRENETDSNLCLLLVCLASRLRIWKRLIRFTGGHRKKISFQNFEESSMV